MAAIKRWQWVAGAFALLAVIALHIPQIARFEGFDPDDYTRLLQVRDWLDGQGWYDTRQYRMNPSAGADIHWVRLGDLPLGAILWLTRQFLPQWQAELAAMTIVPLVQLIAAMIIMRGLLRSLRMPPLAQISGVGILPLMPLVLANFGPMRVDYHGWQAILALAMTAALIDPRQWRAGVGGVIAATWLTLSLEAIAFAALAGAWLGWQYIARGDRRLEPYLIGLASGSVIMTLAFRPPATFFDPLCDVLSWPHIRAFVAIAFLAPMGRLALGASSIRQRLATLVPPAVVAVASIAMPLGICAIRPLAFVDPMARETYFDIFGEAAPIWRQKASAIVMTVWTGAVVAAGARQVLRTEADPAVAARWRTLTALAGAAVLVSFLVARAGVVAQLLAVPFAAVLIAAYLPKARDIGKTVIRSIATVGCFIFATPVGPTAIATPFDQPEPYVRAAEPFARSTRRCDYTQLRRLPPARLLTGIGVAPKILTFTRHAVIAGTYHREGRAIADVARAFSGPEDAAHAIVRRYGSQYVVACLSDVEISYLASKGQHNLAQSLLAGRAPAWLTVAPGFESGPLRVWRVVH